MKKPSRESIPDRILAGQPEAKDWPRLERALAGSSEARADYEQLIAVEAAMGNRPGLTPTQLARNQARLEQALQHPAQITPRRSWWRWLAWATPVVVAASVAVVLVPDRPKVETITPRGANRALAPLAGTNLLTFCQRMLVGGAGAFQGDRCKTSDQLRLAYTSDKAGGSLSVEAVAGQTRIWLTRDTPVLASATPVGIEPAIPLSRLTAGTWRLLATFARPDGTRQELQKSLLVENDP